MKKITITLWSLFLFCTSLSAQIDCNKFLEQGKKAARQENFELAMNSFNSARRCGDKDMGELVDREVAKLFNAINGKKEQAVMEKQRAQEQQKVVEQEKRRALAQQKIAEQEKQRAEEQTKIARIAQEETNRYLKTIQAVNAQAVDALVREVNNLIGHLDYPAAANKLQIAAELDQPTISFKKAVSEIAFFWNETGQTVQASHLLKVIKQSNAPSEKNLLRTWLKTYSDDWHDSLMLRYFPHMVDIICSEDTGKKASFRASKIAHTQITNWQYAIYLASKGKDIQVNKDQVSISLDLEGNNPIVYISWFDAARYANWLSKHFGIDTAYVFQGDNVKYIDYSAKGYRLPNEVEWQYADSLDLYGLSDKVSEWCEDSYASYGGSNPNAFRIFRSSDYPFRRHDGPLSRHYYISFRLVI